MTTQARSRSSSPVRQRAMNCCNRTFKDKPAGLVVDYLGIAEDLKSALADYTKRDRDRQDLGQDLRDQAIPAMLETRDVVDTILHGFDWRAVVASRTPKAFLNALTGTVEYLLSTHPGPDGVCTKEAPCVKHRFMAQASRLTRLFTICVPSDEAMAIRDDVALFEAVRASRQCVGRSQRWRAQTRRAGVALSWTRRSDRLCRAR